MVPVNVTPVGKYDLGRIPYESEAPLRTLKHLFFKLGFTMVDDTTCSAGDLARKAGIYG